MGCRRCRVEGELLLLSSRSHPAQMIVSYQPEECCRSRLWRDQRSPNRLQRKPLQSQMLPNAIRLVRKLEVAPVPRRSSDSCDWPLLFSSPLEPPRTTPARRRNVPPFQPLFCSALQSSCATRDDSRHTPAVAPSVH